MRGKFFHQANTLRNHKRVHTGGKPFECKQCGRCFSQTVHLRIHKRVHTGEKPYECKQCGKRFSQSWNLRTHKRVHTGEKPYECKHRGKSFNEASSLRMHERIHTLLKSRKFSQKNEILSKRLESCKLKRAGGKNVDLRATDFTNNLSSFNLKSLVFFKVCYFHTCDSFHAYNYQELQVWTMKEQLLCLKQTKTQVLAPLTAGYKWFVFYIPFTIIKITTEVFLNPQL